MKKYVVVAAMVVLTACSQQKNSESKQTALDTEPSKVSYAIGLEVANSLKNLGADLDRAVFIEALNAQLDGADVRLTAEEAKKAKQEEYE